MIREYLIIQGDNLTSEEVSERLKKLYSPFNNFQTEEVAQNFSVGFIVGSLILRKITLAASAKEFFGKPKPTDCPIP